MKRRLLDGTDLNVSPICCGGGPFGSALQGKELDNHIAIFRDIGGNFFDTAHCYAFWTPNGAGCSESALGDYMHRNGRGDLVIGTKGGHPGSQGYRRTDHWLSPARIEADIDDSLGRLGIDSLDLFWLHRDDTRLPPGEIVETLNLEMRKGRIRYAGVSNWRTDRIAEANAYATAHGLLGFVANQPEWNLARKNTPNPDPKTDLSLGTAMLTLEEQDVAWHRRVRFPAVPYSSTACGYFATEGATARGACENPVTLRRLDQARSLARELHVTTGQIALAWLLNQNFPVVPIVGPRNPDHLREDLAAVDVRLSPDQMARLTAMD